LIGPAKNPRLAASLPVFDDLIRAAVEDSENRYRAIYENVSEGIYRSSLDGHQISANPALVSLNGYDSEAEMLAAVNDIGLEWYVDPTRRDLFRQLLNEHGRVVDFVSEIYRHRTRERIWVSENAYLVRAPHSGEPVCYEGTVREVTETVRRLELQRQVEKIAAVVPGCIFQFRRSPAGAMSMPYASAGFSKLFGFPPEEVVLDVSRILEIVVPDDLDRLLMTVEVSAQEMSPWQCEFRISLPHRSFRWLFSNSLPEREADGSTLWNGFVTDVTDRKQAEVRIHELAFLDPLTRLPNRRLLLDSLDEALADSARSGSHGAMLFIDLDHFKMLNDTLGHQAGDLLLIEVAARLSANLRSGDAVARFGGDEFVVLAQNLGRSRRAAERSAGEIATGVLGCFDQPCRIADRALRTTPSIGVAIFVGADISPDEIMRRADVAMYETKRGGRNGFRLFRPTMQACEG